jgi:hypothetical protein
LSRIYGENKKIASEVFALTGVKIVETAKVPALICCDCQRALDAAILFREQCRKSDEEFKQTLVQYEKSQWNLDLNLLRESLNNEREADYSKVKCKVEIIEPDNDVQVN